MPKSFDVVIAGGGVLGASAFFQLVNTGLKVCILEKNSIASACTKWSGGVVRCFHLNPNLSDKAVWGWNYYQNFAKHTGHDCDFVSSGFIYFPHERDMNYALTETKRLSQVIPIHLLDDKELEKKFGSILVSPQKTAIYEPQSGYMDPVAVTKAWISAGIQRGGTVIEHVDINSINTAEQGASVIATSQGTIVAQKIVLAVGASTPALLNKLNIDHDLYAQMIQVDIRRPKQVSALQPAYIDDCYDLNGRPNLTEGTVYIGHPTHLRIDEVLEVNPSDKVHSEMIKQQGALRFNWVNDSELVDSLRTPDCYTQDGTGRVMAIDENKNMLIATGFSGGGFKMAPWVGHELTTLVKESL